MRTARPLSIAAALLIATSALAGCSTAPTPYRPVGVRSGVAADGYREVRLEPGRWRVVFEGNIVTSRETVETYMLYRAAELTLAEGYDWFVAVSRDTEAHDTLSVRPPSPTWDPYWSPHWRVTRGGVWRTWPRESAVPPPAEVSKVTAYEAMAEIVMGRGPRPADPQAYDASGVARTLQSTIVRLE
ncbi:MAG: hypothetical protein HYU62_13865 [Caulobacterales bacterium]|nr:hypothetical protein [Caulobacterales bacterium]